MSPTGEIENTPGKIMWVNFLHQVNCETKYTIPALTVHEYWCVEELKAKDCSINQLITKVFIEQHRILTILSYPKKNITKALKI